jgi:stress response protein YsnF
MSSGPTHPASENWLVAVGQIDPSVATTLLQLDSGRVVPVPTSLLLDGALKTSMERIAPKAEETVIPIVQEELIVTKRAVALETVRVEKTVETRNETAEIELSREHFEIVRIPIDKEVSAQSTSRQEGNTTIYPVFEERLIARTVLFLKEEVHVTRVVTKVVETVEAELRRDVVNILRNIVPVSTT